MSAGVAGIEQRTVKYVPPKRKFSKILKVQWMLILMSVPLVLYRLLFSYVPLFGWVVAFQDFKPQFGLTPIQQFLNSDWVGLSHFQKLLDYTTLFGSRFLNSVYNTFGQALLTQVIGFICAIGLSLLLNEVRQKGIKRVIQNILYLPHFLSWVIVAGLAGAALSLPASGGFINEALMWIGIIKEPIIFLGNPDYFWGVVAGTHLWKNLGWNTIIYLAAITSIDPSLYEAAAIDGANRYRQMWHITLAGIRPTIVILLIMNTGWLLQSGFEIQYFLGQTVTQTRAENIDIFVLYFGLRQNNFGLSTAASILRTVVSVTMLSIVNFIAGRLGEDRLV